MINKLRLNDTQHRPYVKDWINQVYADVCVETEALQQSATMNLTANVASYTLPTQILRFKFVAGAPSTSPTGYGPPLKSVSIDEILNLRQTGQVNTASGGTVTMYSLVGMNQLEVFPTPTAADVLLVYYVYLPVALAADADVPVLQEPFAGKLLEAGATFEGAVFLKDPDIGFYRDEYQAKLRRFRAHLNRRQSGEVQQIQVAGNTPRIVLDRSADVWN